MFIWVESFFFLITIVLLLIDGFALMSYSAAVEVLRAANLLAGRRLYDIQHIPGKGVRSVSSSGAIVEGTVRLDENSDFDLVLVVAGGDPENFQDPKVFRWLRQVAHQNIRLGGVSGGPLILASAGLMRGRRMTVHWEHVAALSEMSPGLIVERSLYVIDRDRITCAGGSAPLDMMHAILTEQHGATFARRVSDWFMHTEVRPSGGPQRAGLVERYATSKPAVIAAIQMMESHMADPLSLTQLAALTGCGSRQLNRLFRNNLGQSTMSFYRYLRLEMAFKLLTQSTLTIMEVALASGFSTAAHFARSFRSRYQKTPSSLRPPGIVPFQQYGLPEIEGNK